jgi:hypothetical protein
MSDVAENGSTGGARPLLPSESHDEFLELCALATTELLSAQERRRLEEHLRDCATCREAFAQYQALVDTGSPAVSVVRHADHVAKSGPGRSLDEAEAALFARLDREEAQTASFADGPNPAQHPAQPATHLVRPLREVRDEPSDGLWRQMWWQYAAGIILVVALGYSVYRTGIHKGAELTEGAAPVAHTPSPGAGKSLAGADPVPSPASNAQSDAIRAQLDSKVAEIAKLEAERAALEENLRSTESNRDQLQQNAEHLTRQLAASQADLEATKQRLDAAGGQNTRDTFALAALQRQIDEFKSSLAQRDQELAREQELLDHDQDIRELMGSRNLYIAEVYDVAKTGDTQRSFGRVFYTKGKSLIFYAYDLDPQPGLRDASTFQAWGRRGPGQARAVNLGILYVDNVTQKRWVLKADDPKTLADIDAVFVTVEPHGGSSHPSGKPLLFAYLRIEPNHP